MRSRPMKASLVRISVRSHSDAECVAAALGRFDSRIDWDGERWVVEAMAAGGMRPYVMSALKSCLDQNEIASATVTFGERSYVLEGRR